MQVAFETTVEQTSKGVLRSHVATSVLGFAIAAVSAAMVYQELFLILAELLAARRFEAVALHALFCTIVTFLLYGGFVYLVARGVCYWRTLRCRPATPLQLQQFCASESLPSLAVLIPSYLEEPKIITRTLLSAALQTYPRKRVVLLIDDSPTPRTSADCELLDAARELPSRIARQLAEPRQWIIQASELLVCEPAGVKAHAAAWTLLRQLESWFETLAQEFDETNHEEALFVERVVRAHQRYCRANRELLAAEEWRTSSDVIKQEALVAIYSHLLGVFSVELRSFERKAFENLSHEPNKAMNLNSYIGLMGCELQVERFGAGLHLVPATQHGPRIAIPDSKYLLTLDADSIIMPEYACRLVHFMEQPQHQRVAVVQTPYNSFPKARRPMERLAGATTDIQYLIHQGFTGLNGTYWVGANALLRKRALMEIAGEQTERGFTVRRFIHDRTVIEDTESSIDLIGRGWSLYNYPARLAFSSTPPDFGSLLIQRRRWANGGLILLPKLVRYHLSRCLQPRAWGEAFFRIHYLVSIAAVNVGLLVVLAVPFTENIRSWWLPLAALPYFLLYAEDLRLSGHRRRDVLGVYALNLLLIPVNLGGVLKSLQQMCTRRKIPFGRTPKVDGRTPAGAIYVVAVYLLLLQWLATAGVGIQSGRYFQALFAFGNAAFLSYAIGKLVGLSNSWEDISSVVPLRGSRPQQTAAQREILFGQTGGSMAELLQPKMYKPFRSATPHAVTTPSASEWYAS